MNTELLNTVNKCLEVYHGTDAEQYPLARAIDKLDELVPFGRDRQQAYNLLIWAVDSMNEETL